MATPTERAVEVISARLVLLVPRIAVQLANSLDADQLLADLLDLDRAKARTRSTQRQLEQAREMVADPGYSLSHSELADRHDRLRGLLK
jgi:hypothetical protein